MSYIKPLDKQRKTHRFLKNIIYIFILRPWRLCEVGIQSERVSTYLLLWLGPFLWSSAAAGEHTRGNRHVCLRDQRTSSFAWVVSGSLSLARVTSRSLPSVQNYRFYIAFSSPMRIYEYPLRTRIFLLTAGYRNLHTSVVFFGNLLILPSNGNICHSFHWQ